MRFGILSHFAVENSAWIFCIDTAVRATDEQGLVFYPTFLKVRKMSDENWRTDVLFGCLFSGYDTGMFKLTT